MKDTRPTLSRPVYESLPAIYVLAGVIALALSYVRGRGWLSSLLALAGLAGVIGGGVVWLRRRDFRTLRDKYPGGSGDF
ncbi:MAG: hypothetical protein WCE48_11420 [Steroidobacteraceae bacterium]